MSNSFKFGNPIQLVQLASDPTGLENGTLYYNTTTNKMRSYEGGSWGNAGSLVGQAINQYEIIVGSSSNLSVAVNSNSLGDVLASASGLSIKSGVITASHLASAFSLPLSKLASLNTSIVVITDGSGKLTSSTITATELGYLSGATSNLQQQITNITSSGTGANTTLSNLTSPTAINQALLPSSDLGVSLGSTSKRFYYLYATSLRDSSDQPVVNITDRKLVSYSTGSQVTLLDFSGENPSFNSKKLTNLADGTANTDAATVGQVTTSLGSYLPKGGGSMTGNIVMQNNRITGLPSPSADSEPATKGWVNTYIGAGVVWLSPVLEPDLVADQVSTPPSSPVTGDAYIIGSSATGAWAGKEGHAVYWDGSAWANLLVDGSSNPRAVAIGDRFGVAVESTTTPTGGVAGKAKSIVQVTDATPGAITYTETTPTANVAFYVSNDLSSHFGHSYTYNATTSSWVEFGGPSSISAGVGLSWSANTLNVGVGAGIKELPSDEIGVDAHADGGLFLTVDGSTSSTFTNAQLAIKLDGSTLSRSSSGLKVANNSLTTSQLSASAGILFSQMESLTANMLPVIGSDGKIASSGISSTIGSYLANVTSDIQTQLDGKASTTLNNLGTTSINANLTPSAHLTRMLGNLGAAWLAVRTGRVAASSASIPVTITTTSGSNQVTVSSATGLASGSFQALVSSAFASTVTITSVSGTTLTVSANATSSVSGQAATVVPYLIIRPENETVSGTASGIILMKSGDSVAARSGDVSISTGAVTGASGNSGDILISTGTSAGGSKGAITLSALNVVVKTDDNQGLVINNPTNSSGNYAVQVVKKATISSNQSTFADVITAFDVSLASSATFHYEAVEATSGKTRAGTFKVAYNSVNSDIAFLDSWAETAAIGNGLSFQAVKSGSAIMIQAKDTGSNAVTFRAYGVIQGNG